jgi:hypothetical protein
MAGGVPDTTTAWESPKVSARLRFELRRRPESAAREEFEILVRTANELDRAALERLAGDGIRVRSIVGTVVTAMATHAALRRLIASTEIKSIDLSVSVSSTS